MNHNKLPTDLGFKLKKIREVSGLTQETVADAVNISKRTLIKIETNATDTSFSTINNLVEFYQFTISQVIDLDIEELAILAIKLESKKEKK